MLDRTNATALRADDAARLWRDGFLHIPAVIPSDEVGRLISETRAAAAKANFHETSMFAELIEQRRVHELVQTLFDETIYYFGWSNAMLVDEPGPGKEHDDAKGPAISVNGRPREFFDYAARPFDPIKHATWPVWRLFIYLDDHVQHSGGTKVRRQSYKRYEALTKRGLRAIMRGRFGQVLFPGLGYVNPRVRPGDAVLFNLRCRHSGQFIRWRGSLANTALPSNVDHYIGRIVPRVVLDLFACPFIEERTSLVVDFATDSDWARGFQANRLLHPTNERHRQQFFDCVRPEFISRLARVSLPVLPNKGLPALTRFLGA
jgi:hypothetical protein